jgi:hypothetical protein
VETISVLVGRVYDRERPDVVVKQHHGGVLDGRLRLTVTNSVVISRAT